MFKSRPGKFGDFCIMFNDLNACADPTLGHYWSNIKGLLDQRITLTKFLNRIDAKINGWIDAYSHCANIRALSDMLKDCRQRVIKDVLVTGLGIQNPNSEIRQFLELDPIPSRRNDSTRNVGKSGHTARLAMQLNGQSPTN